MQLGVIVADFTLVAIYVIIGSTANASGLPKKWVNPSRNLYVRNVVTHEKLKNFTVFANNRTTSRSKCHL